MDTTVVLRQQHQPRFDSMIGANLKLRSTSVASDAGKARVAPLPDADRDRDKGIVAPDHPAALRARLKHRALPEGASGGTYDTVRDTARQLAELERLRAQDLAYIRTLEHTRATLVRDTHAAARARAEAERAAAEEREREERRWRREAEEAARGEAEERERARAERAEARVAALEAALGAARGRVVELEDAVERERRRREEWESGLEALALGGSSVVA